MMARALRKEIESATGYITDELFKEALNVAEADIRANRLILGKRTNKQYILYVLISYIRIVQALPSAA